MQTIVNSTKDQSNQNPNGKRPKGLSLLFLSWFYSGLMPKAPGTFGSLATLPLLYVLSYLQFNTYSLIALTISLFFTAVLVTEKVQQQHGLHDPQWIVVDEVIGMLITWIFIQRIDLLALATVFISFRIFDIIKIWPASYFDRLHHGIGTITDDVISGLYAGIVSLLILNFF
jgi:phosphatidylglycerophosphatase A